VHALPPGRRAAREQNVADTWNPSLAEIEALPHLLNVQEESSCVLRVVLAAIGSLNLRALTLHCCSYGAGPGGVAQQTELMTITRPCRMGTLCCCPLEMTMREAGPGSALLGRVVEECSCSEVLRQCFCWTCTHHVLAARTPGAAKLDHRYSLRTSLCCCGRVNNCFGATCCKPNLILDILSADDNKLVSTVQKTYAAGAPGFEGCMRCAVEFDNYIVEFPADATPIERALLVNAVLSSEYAYFSRSGGDDE
jgi:hypothetical protein